MWLLKSPASYTVVQVAHVCDLLYGDTRTAQGEINGHRVQTASHHPS